MDISIQQAIVHESFLALGLSSPNPPVAAVLTDSSGKILAQAHTQISGSNHAERELYLSYFDPSNYKESNFELSTQKIPNQPIPSHHNLYVSLEPCSHFGKTPPCRDLILNKKPNNLYVGHLDPNPLVAKNRNWDLYLKNGIQYNLSNDLKLITQNYLDPFFTRLTLRRPKIILKSAVSQEGFFSTLNPSQISISNQESSIPLALLRAKVDCILVGPKTSYIDHPSLSFRIPTNLKFHLDAHLNRNYPTNKKDHTLGNFWSDLLFFSKEPTIWDYTLKNVLLYQPIRAFVLSPRLKPNLSFFEKQKSIQETFAKERELVIERMIQLEKGKSNRNPFNWNQLVSIPKVVFFTLQNENSSEWKDPQLMDAINQILNVSIVPIQEKNFGEGILNHLAELSVNQVLIEGGNSLYKEFYPLLDAKDEILIVQNSSLELKRGIKPSFYDLLKEEIFQTRVGSDIWKVYNKE
jgi:diaminohydroxyphosphoribosylaminopyrimidine deaminase/5-amino-6-(5-phosphoribosylamino)uracil reductase